MFARTLRLTVIVLSLLLLCAPDARAVGSSFDAGPDGWIFYGDGDGEFRAGIGAEHPGCLYLSCNMGESSTVYGKFTLTPGRYTVSCNIRMLDVQGKRFGPFWIFYEASDKVVFPNKELHGSFGWKRVSFPLDVKRPKVTLWFRLLAPGMVWIDDLTVTPARDSADFQAVDAGLPPIVPNPVGVGVRCPDCRRWYDPNLACCPVCGLPRTTARSQSAGASSRLLLGFEADAEGREKGALDRQEGYRTDTATQGERAAIVPADRFVNIDVNRVGGADWDGFDYLALDVFNPSGTTDKFSLALGDSHGSGYWQEQNHFSALTPGWNHLKFRITRFVGERGSVKVKRYLDLRNIRKAWFFIDTGKKGDPGRYAVDNVRLLTAPVLLPFKGALLFDFVKNAIHTQRGFIGVESKTVYHPEVGFGFQDQTFWRTQDSMYADELHRDGIFILSGKFLVDLPNGRYVVRLVPNTLGYWNEHFWKKRKVTVEGRVLLDESRDDAAAYLRDQLRFADVEPSFGQSAYDLYLKEIFKPYTTEVDVRDGQLTIECSGSDSGLLLNSLIIYPVASKSEAPAFFASLDDVLKDEFASLCRDITASGVQGETNLTPAARDKGFYTALIPSDVQLRYNQILPSAGDHIALAGGMGERPVQALMVRNLRDDATLRVACTPLTSASGQVLKPAPAWIRYGVQQYQSHTMNHEVYELAPRFLKDLGSDGVTARRDESLLLWFQVPLTGAIKPGTYDGTLRLTLNGQRTEYPVSLQVRNYRLPKVDVAVGFFGLSPVDFGYFQSPDVPPLLRSFRHKALQALAARGFTTWTGLPPGEWKLSKNGVSLQTDVVDDLMQKARELGFDKKVFSYGGWSVIDLKAYGPVAGMDQETFRRRTAAALEEHMRRARWLPLVLDITDEATGYAQTVDRDRKRADMMREYYPFLRRGGYTQPIEPGKKGAELNLALTDISLSSQTPAYADLLKGKGIRWGYYNQAIKPFSNGRYAFGVGLYRAAKAGLDHQLGWCLTGSQNYPYYDLDGREYDAMMLFPRADGGLDYALKFEWAAQGLEDYRLLQLLEQLVHKGGPEAAEAGAWLEQVASPAFGTPTPGQGIPVKGDGDAVFAAFRTRLDKYIETLSR